jgi:hypothetical protein
MRRASLRREVCACACVRARMQHALVFRGRCAKCSRLFPRLCVRVRVRARVNVRIRVALPTCDLPLHTAAGVRAGAQRMASCCLGQTRASAPFLLYALHMVACLRELAYVHASSVARMSVGLYARARAHTHTHTHTLAHQRTHTVAPRYLQGRIFYAVI